MYSINQADLTSFIPEKEKYHALICDPPYELGFMNKAWDNSGIAFSIDFWKRMKDSLLPGAFCMAFSSTRTVHRMMVAIEDAGFIIHPMIGWIFGTGFPKATRIDTQIDAAGVEQEVVGPRVYVNGLIHNRNISDFPIGTFSQVSGIVTEKKAMTEQAKIWQGHRYGGQALKPAFEPIVVFQKLYEGKPFECIVRTGAGALDIENNRIATQDNLNGGAYIDTKENLKRKIYGTCGHIQEQFEQPVGRWPANIIIGDEVAKEVIDKQSGVLKSPTGKNIGGKQTGRTSGQYNSIITEEFGDKGGASRFFYNVQSKLDEADLFQYQAKASGSERNMGLGEINNNHPTVKPIDLIRHLSSLLLPPKEYADRKIIVPFSGSGSEMIGALLAGWEQVDGIEISQEYIDIAKARIEHWIKKDETLFDL